MRALALALSLTLGPACALAQRLPEITMGKTVRVRLEGVTMIGRVARRVDPDSGTMRLCPRNIYPCDVDMQTVLERATVTALDVRVRNRVPEAVALGLALGALVTVGVNALQPEKGPYDPPTGGRVGFAPPILVGGLIGAYIGSRIDVWREAAW